MNRIETAQAFAHAAHDAIKQVRKYDGRPYWVHTDAVAATVASVGGTEDMIVAAHLHDVLEDVTPLYPAYSEGQIRVQFGENVLKLVVELTDVYTKEAFPKLNRAERKTEERKRLATISPEAKTIKLADLIDNTASIVKDDPDFATVYLKEKFAILPYLADGSPELLQRASIQTITAMTSLGLTIPTIHAIV